MAENQLKKGIKNIKYSLIAQIIILVTGVVKTLIVPSVLTVESYAYWQMYLFYIGYVGFFYLGFNDGILLKYGKYDYDDLPFDRIRRSMHYYIYMLAAFTAVSLFFTLRIDDPQKAFVMTIVAASILMYGLNGVFIYIFLITNQIKRHSFFTAVDSLSSFVGVLLVIALKQSDFHLLVYFVFIVKLISVIVMACLCRKILFGQLVSAKEGFIEFLDNIRAGIFLMLAQIMSMLVTGLGRIFIEYTKELENYAYYSFGITVLNIVMVGITAVATVMYPTLGRVEEDLLPKIFKRMYSFFSHTTVLILLLFFPAYVLVGLLFPQYSPMLSYFCVMFAMVTWQAKVNITTNSYFRVLRMERKMLVINLESVIFFCIACAVLMFTLGKMQISNIFIVAVSTCLSMVFLELLAEGALRKRLGLRFDKQIWIDLIINAVFLACACIRPIYIGFAAYVTFMVLYAFVQKRDIKSDILFIKDNFKKA